MMLEKHLWLSINLGRVIRKRLAKKKLDNQGDEESTLEFWEARCTAKREVTKEKEKACSEL